MTRSERALLFCLAEEIILHLRNRLAEIENLHPGSRRWALPRFRSGCAIIEELLDGVKKEHERSN